MPLVKVNMLKGKSMENSKCVGLYVDGVERLVGFARVIGFVHDAHMYIYMKFVKNVP